MAILRQLNVLGQQRLDVPHIRSIESSIAADFDVVAGRVQAGGKALVVRGFTLANFTAGTNATSIQLGTADGILYNMNSSEAGTFLWVPADRGVEVLNSATNPRVQGGFTAGQVNYIGLDLIRTADDTTSDLVQFLDPNTLLEQAKNVPLARTLDYRIVISTTPFSASPNIIPIAKVKTDNQNQVDTPTNAVEDARNIMWRLGSGGDFPNQYGAFTWPQNRLEYDPNVGALSTLDKFSGGDKGITSQKDWMDAVMMRLWELGGGQNWYSPTADRNVKMTKAPGVVFASTGDNFEWVAGAYSSNHLHWQGLKIVFENANITGVYYNTVQDQTNDDLAGSAALSKTALAIGDCLYVDLDRTSNATVTAKKAAIQTLGAPVVPGSRMILAWRDTSGEVYTRDNSFPVNTSFTPATPTSLGSVRLSRNYVGTVASPAGSNGSPIVISDRGGVIVAVSGSNHDGLSITGDGTGRGIYAKGGATGARGGYFEGTSNFEGVYSRSLGTGWGIVGVGGTGAAGGRFEGGTGGRGLEAVGEGAGDGAHITAGATGTGLVVIAPGGPGATITVSSGSGRGLDISAQSGQGLRVASTGGGAGVQINKTGSGAGLDVQAGGATGYGVFIQGNNSAVSLAVNSGQAFWADFQGGNGDGFTLPGGLAANFQGGSALSNPVAGSMVGGDGLHAAGGQGFGHNGTAFGGGAGGVGLTGTGGKGGDIIAGGTGTAGDGGDGARFQGGAGGDNVSSSAGGVGGRGLWVKGGTGGTSTSGPEGAGGIGMTLIGGDGNNASNPGLGLWVFGGSGGSGNASAIVATPSGTGWALDASARIRVQQGSTSEIETNSAASSAGNVLSSIRPLMIYAAVSGPHATTANLPYSPGTAGNILLSGQSSNTAGSAAVQVVNRTTLGGIAAAFEVSQWNGSSYAQVFRIGELGNVSCERIFASTTAASAIGLTVSASSNHGAQITTTDSTTGSAAVRAIGFGGAASTYGVHATITGASGAQAPRAIYGAVTGTASQSAGVFGSYVGAGTGGFESGVWGFCDLNGGGTSGAAGVRGTTGTTRGYGVVASSANSVHSAFRIEPRGVTPSTGLAGDIFVSLAPVHLYFHNGAGWVQLD